MKIAPPVWANLGYRVIESNPQYIADPGTGEIVVQPGWIEITTEEQLAEVQQQIQSLTPPPATKPIADFAGFREDIEVVLTEPFLNTLATLNNSLMLSLRDGFIQQDLPSILKYWNRAISDHPVELAVVLESEHEGQTKADFAKEKAVEHHLPFTLDDSYHIVLVG